VAKVIDDRTLQNHIIAMPPVKKWYKTIGVGELFIKEVEKGEFLKPATESK